MHTALAAAPHNLGSHGGAHSNTGSDAPDGNPDAIGGGGSGGGGAADVGVGGGADGELPGAFDAPSVEAGAGTTQADVAQREAARADAEAEVAAAVRAANEMRAAEPGGS